MTSAAPTSTPSGQRWYQGVTRTQWTILAIACSGWIFDSYGVQVFNITRVQMLAEFFGHGIDDPAIKFWGDVFQGIALLGGAVGGTYFGSLADRIGRRPALILTTIIFTIACGLTGLAQAAWQVAVLRFVVALGTAGAWTVGASIVAEVFSPRTRAQAGSVFHSTSNIGTWFAAIAGIAVGSNWRLAYFLGAIPIVLVFWIRAAAKEPATFKAEAAHTPPAARGSLKELLFVQPWSQRAIFGMLLAAVGIGTYWTVTVGGQDLVQDFLQRRGVAATEAVSKAKFAYGYLINGGGFIGALAFGPFAQWLGRRRAFACAMIAGLLIVPITWYLPQTYGQLVCVLPFYGMLTFGFHAGFAFYFPELFPTHLRGTGAGFCFNGGRVIAATILVLSGRLKSLPGVDLRVATCALASLYLLGLVCLRFLPETKGEKLAEV